MNRPAVQQWIEALQSKDIKKCEKNIAKLIDGELHLDANGVAVYMHDQENWIEDVENPNLIVLGYHDTQTTHWHKYCFTVMPPTWRNFYGLSSWDYSKINQLNDDNKSFNKVIEYLKGLLNGNDARTE